MGIRERLASFLTLELEELDKIIRAAPTNYKRYNIAKRSGGQRTIFQPAKQTKAVQYALMDIALCKLPVHAAATAYRHGLQAPLLINASVHAKYRYNVKTDFMNFFPSIHPSDLYRTIEDHFGTGCLSTEDESLLRNALFIKQGMIWGLAIGAPSSPMISNAIMYKLDQQIAAEASSIAFVSAYTRYADDIAFSCDEKGGCNKFIDVLSVRLKNTRSPSLLLNAKKTLYTSRKGRRIIVGLFITPDGKVSIGRDNKRKLRALLHKYLTTTLPKKDLDWLRGYISFLIDVEPSYYNRLVIKYGSAPFEKLKRNAS